MTPEEIRQYRVRSWSEFVGTENAPAIRRLQHAAIAGKLPPPLLLIGPYGMGKTSVARHLQNAFGCLHRNPDTGDADLVCEDCRREWIRLPSGHWKQEGTLFTRWEIDCTRIAGKGDMLELLKLIEQEERVSLFVDEFHRIADRQAAETLLKFSEDFHRSFEGPFIIAITNDKFARMPAPLFERLRKVWLTMPTVDEMTPYFDRMLPIFEVADPKKLIREMVVRSGRSFRTCLDVLAAAREKPGSVLDREALDEFLPPASPDEQSGLPEFYGVEEDSEDAWEQ